MEPLTLSELTARTARHWRTVLTGLLTGLLVGAGAHLAVPARFEAVAVLRVDAADPALVDMTAEEAVATSRRVTAESLDTLGDPELTITELEDAITATAVKGSRLLRIAFVASRPRAATRGADAVAQAYLATRAVDRGVEAGPRASDVTGVVVDAARTPTSPVGPGRGTAALAGCVLGLLVAVPVAARRAGPARLSRTAADRAA